MIEARIHVPELRVESWAEYHGVSPSDKDFVEFCQQAEREQKLYGNKILDWKPIPGGVAFKLVADTNKEQIELAERGEWPPS